MTEEKKEVAKPGFGWRFLAFFGFVRDRERRLGFRLKFRFFIFGFLAFLIVGLGGASAYSTSPSFCRSCHIMEPYYTAWANSKHYGKATCVDCHYPPGETSTILWKKFQALSQVAKFVTRTYSSKPYAEVEDISCLRSGCHSTRLLEGKVITKRGIRFDHRPHLEQERKGRQLRCTSCHSQVVVGKHIEVTYDTCYLCHLKGSKHERNIEALGGCTGCHQLPTREIKVGNITYNHQDFMSHSKVSCDSCHQDAVQGNGDVDEDRCRTCHNQEEKLARFKDIPFIHDNHVTKHNTACFHCHREIRHQVSKAGAKKLGYDCASCHTDMHDLPRGFYMGIGARGIEASPSPMYLANVDCVGCHVDPKHGEIGKEETFEGSEKGCVNCHGKEYTGVLTEAKGELKETLEKLKANLEAVQKALPGEALPELQDVAYNLKLLGSVPMVHNIYYASRILRDAEEKIAAVAKEKKVSIEKASALPVVSGTFCGTLCHPRVGVQVPPVEMKFLGKKMPHKQHAEDLGCTTCHTFGEHKTVFVKKDVVTSKSLKKCKNCHEE